MAHKPTAVAAKAAIATSATTPPQKPSRTQVTFPAGVTPHLVYANDFSSPVLDPNLWNVYNGAGNAGFGLRSPSAFSFDGHGDLVITASMRNGVIVSGGMGLRANQTYGRYEFRVRTDADPSGATSGVVLTWPQSENWPVDGESDVYETGPNPTRNFITSNIHYGATNQQVNFKAPINVTQWHTFVMDWTASAISIYSDTALIGRTTNPAAVPHVPQHLCLQLDAVNSRSLIRPVHMYVDYVKVYAVS